jgi:hypothetical protein
MSFGPKSEISFVLAPPASHGPFTIGADHEGVHPPFSLVPQEAIRGRKQKDGDGHVGRIVQRNSMT